MSNLKDMERAILEYQFEMFRFAFFVAKRCLSNCITISEESDFKDAK